MEISKNWNLRPACCSFTFDKVRNKLRVVIKSCSVAATQRSFCAGYIHKYFGVITKLSLQLYWDPNYSFHIILQNNPKSFGALTRKEMPNGYLRDRVITLPQSLDLSLHILFFPYDWLERLCDFENWNDREDRAIFGRSYWNRASEATKYTTRTPAWRGADIRDLV